MSVIALKVKSKVGQQVIRDLNSDSSVGQLKALLSGITELKAENIIVLFGFPPKPLDLADDSKTIKEAGLSSGETLIVEEKKTAGPTSSNEISNASSITLENGNAEGSNLSKKKGILMKQVVPSDNSCLFTSIGFVLNGQVDTSVGTLMRQIIAMEVAGDPITYSEAFLGKPNPEYCEWIQFPSSWGGAIEVSVLSRFYGIEMDVIDTMNTMINRFGEDQNYGQRVFLLFDGIHYDPVYMELATGGSQTIFPSEDMDVYSEAEQLAREAKSSRQFTDVNKFTLKCMICDKLLTGQVEAQKHAKETTHTNFGEV